MSNATRLRTEPSDPCSPESSHTAFFQTPLRSLSGSIPAAALAGAVVLAAGTSLRPGEVAAQPVYEERTGSANPLDDLEFVGVSRPSLVDIDGDGDLDAIVSARSEGEK
jgi:hypothetical protein